MTCRGLHCEGCRDGGGLVVVIGVAGLAVASAAEWVLARVWYVLTVTAACFALAVWAVVMLMRWQARREARHAIDHPFLTVRLAPVLLAEPARPQVAPPAPPAVVNYYHGLVIQFPGMSERDVAAVVRAVPGHAGTAITGPED